MMDGPITLMPPPLRLSPALRFVTRWLLRSPVLAAAALAAAIASSNALDLAASLFSNIDC